jgi:hypothetical protein
MDKSVGYLFLFLMIYLTACDPAIGYQYYIENNSEKELKVRFAGAGSNDSTETILVIPNSEILFYEVTVWGKNPHDEKEDFLSMLDTLNISATDSSQILLDYLKRESWIYNNDIGHIGLVETGTNIYTLEIMNEDFEE